MPQGYIHDSYCAYASGSEQSAIEVARVLLPLLEPASVLDVGCGTGAWLEAFRHCAGSDLRVHGVDGPWSPARDRLRPGEFSECQFETSDGSDLVLPIDRFDLVMSLEFVEHVSEQRADALVDFLTSKGDAVLVSAAIPLQGGQHHVNERWPEYWAAKFRERGFVPFDVLRLIVWDNPAVASWYRQNMVLYFRGSVPEAVRQRGTEEALKALDNPRAMVHPEFYARKHGRLHHALTRPLSFLKLLAGERDGRPRGIPPIPRLGREPA